MSEYLTVPNVALVLSLIANVAAALIAGLRWMAPRTATTIDDQAVANIDGAKAWAEKWAPTFWMMVEAATKTGRLPTGVNKTTEFIIQLRDAFKREHGKEMPVQAEAVAGHVAADLSASDKLVKLDPRFAPPVVAATR